MTGLSSIRRRAGHTLGSLLRSASGRAELLAGLAGREEVHAPVGLEAECEVFLRVVENHRSDGRVMEAALGRDLALALGLWFTNINPFTLNVQQARADGLHVSLDLTATPSLSVGGLEWSSDQEFGSYHSQREELFAALWVNAPSIYERWMFDASRGTAPSVRAPFKEEKA